MYWKFGQAGQLHQLATFWCQLRNTHGNLKAVRLGVGELSGICMHQGQTRCKIEWYGGKEIS